ncbi:monodehydroascorbate reductase [Tanacetum coccineum]|uniref:Monodehydroascorbate reductase n=1 Tax=Tanacetum coccineum TaxID=301880 RepID=A0ABQ4ZCS3_9ASTR
MHDKMAEQNVPAPTQTDAQLVPVKAHLPIGNINLLMDLQKMQKNPIFRISVDILQNTNFFRVFTASADVPSIYALGITPKDTAHPFVPPPAGDLVIDFVNNLGYLEELQFARPLVVTDLDTQFFKCCGGVVTGTNVDYAELIWEAFIHAINNFFSDMANLKVPTKKPKPPVIPYCRFTKLIIYYLGRVDEVFGMRIPKDLITDAIRNSEYYKKYLEMDAGKPRQPTTMTGEEAEKKKKALKAVEDDEYNLQRGIQMSLESLQALIGGVVVHEPNPWFIRKLPDVEGKGKRRPQVTQDASTGPSAQLQDDTSTNVVHDTSSLADSTNDAETAADMEQSNNETYTEILNVVEERDPGKTPESQPPPERELMEEDQAGSNPRQSDVAQAGPNPEPMHEDFIATVYPENLEDAFTFGDQFLNDKSTEEEPGKANVETEVESIVTVPIHQASPSVPPLFTPIIDLSPPKPMSPPVQESIYTTTTATTTTLLPPPPLLLQSTTDPDLATCVSALEKRSADFEQKNKLQDKTTQALASRVYKLEHHDLYSKIDKQVNEVVKEAVHNALQAPLRERFIDLSEFQRKEILQDRMFESNSYISHLDHTTLYEALEASMQHENNDELHAALTKSCKKHRDDQDPPPPPPKESDLNKKKKHDSDVPASKQPLPINDDPIPDNMYLSESEDTDAAHILKIKTRPNWLTLLPEEETPETPEPDWVIPPNDLPETKNNWADAMAKTYKDPEENKLLRETGDMASLIQWYCKPIGKKKLVKADFKGQAYKIVRPFHKNNISLQFQMEECHLLLTDQIDLINPEGNRVVHDMRKPLPLGGPPDLGSRLQNLHPNDFEDMYLLNLQRKLNHLSGSDKVYLSTAVNLWTRNIVIRQRVEDLQLDIESYQTNLKITQPRWDATDFLFKEDYTIVHKPMAVIYRDRNNKKKMMRETKVHKFSDGTLRRILEKLDYMVKYYELYKYNPGMENRIWNEDDKRISQEFIKLIERRLKIRRIFRSLESFVIGRIRDIDYRLIERTKRSHHSGAQLELLASSLEDILRDTENKAVRLMMFPLSLTGKAKTWLDELNEGTIETWDELRTAFISRFFPPALFD